MGLVVMWWFPKTRGMGGVGPGNKDHSMWGFLLGPRIQGTTVLFPSLRVFFVRRVL